MTTRIQNLAILALGFATAPAVAQTPAERALEKLREGNRRYVEETPSAHSVDEGKRRTLARGARPYAIVVCCADSRVAPEHIFDTGLGEVFTVRVAGNVCTPETLASIEYAADFMGVPLCVVMTHDGCTIIRAAVENEPKTEALSRILERVAPAVRRAESEGLSEGNLLESAERENAYETISQAMRRSAVLRDLVRRGRLRMVAARYLMQTGDVEWLPKRVIEPVDPRPAVDPGQIHGSPPHVVLPMLQAGHRRFLSGAHLTADTSPERRTALARGQRPTAVVVTCSDSRVSPEILFDAGLGEISVVRVVGNGLDEEVLGSIEEAARAGASLCLILGHRSCGAFAAAADEPAATHMTPAMRQLLRRLEPAVERARLEGHRGRALVDRAAELNALRFAEEAQSRSALLHRLASEGRFALLSAVYDLESGQMSWPREKSLPQPMDPFPPSAPSGETAPAPRPGSEGSGDELSGDAASVDRSPENFPENRDEFPLRTQSSAPDSSSLAPILGVALVLTYLGVALFWLKRSGRTLRRERT